MKVIRFLLGLAIGAGVALLVAPKSGRELRQQLAGGASGKLLGAAPDQYPQPEPVAEWGGAATAVADAPGAEEPWAPPEPMVDDVVVVEEAVVEETPRPFPVWEEPAATPESEDLRARIDETRATLESELAQPFADETAEVADEAAAVADDAVVDAAAAELVAEEAVVEAVAAELVAEEAVVEAEVADIVADEAVNEAVVAEVVAEEAVADALLAGDQDAPAAELVAEEAIAEAEAATVIAEEAVAEADAAEVVAEVAIAEAVVSEVIAEEAVAEAVVEDAVAAEAVEEADLAETVAEEAAVEEAVADEVVAEAPLAGQEPEPFLGPVTPPQIAQDTPAEPEPMTDEAPAQRPHAWDIAYDEEPVLAEEPIVAEEPIIAEEPAAAAAPAREGGGIDQAEMRRRIEETRARLKAKAFDAMMSGEAALLSRDSGEKPVPGADDVALDAETDSAIDESLSQEEY
jgi:transcription termination factor Rho